MPRAGFSLSVEWALRNHGNCNCDAISLPLTLMETLLVRRSLQIALLTCSASAQDALVPVQKPEEKLNDVVVTADTEPRATYSIPAAPGLLKLEVPIIEMPQ